MFFSSIDNFNDIALIESSGKINTYLDLQQNVSDFSTSFTEKHLIFIIKYFFLTLNLSNFFS